MALKTGATPKLVLARNESILEFEMLADQEEAAKLSLPHKGLLNLEPH